MEKHLDEFDEYLKLEKKENWKNTSSLQTSDMSKVSTNTIRFLRRCRNGQFWLPELGSIAFVDNYNLARILVLYLVLGRVSSSSSSSPPGPYWLGNLYSTGAHPGLAGLAILILDGTRPGSD